MVRVCIIDTEDSPAWGPGATTFADYMRRAFVVAGEDAVTVVALARDAAARVPAPEDADAFIITGSHYCVRDAPPWQGALAAFVRSLFAGGSPAGARCLGICYGHQLVAHALGGGVSANPGGRLVLRTEECRFTAALVAAPWAQARATPDGSGALVALTGGGGDDGVATTPLPAQPSVRVIESHGDCVSAVPAAATVLARSASCDAEWLSYAGGRIVTLQGHPEFDYESCIRDRIWPYAVGVMRRLAPDEAAAALESFGLPTHEALVRQMLRRFLCGGGGSSGLAAAVPADEAPVAAVAAKACAAADAAGERRAAAVVTERDEAPPPVAE